MPLSIAVQKDIGEYREKIVFGLSSRQLVCLAVGVGCAAAEAIVGMVMFGRTLDDLFIAMCLTLTAAFLLGFVNPYGLKFSLAARLYLDQWLGSTKLMYKSTVCKQAEKAR